MYILKISLSMKDLKNLKQKKVNIIKCKLQSENLLLVYKYKVLQWKQIHLRHKINIQMNIY